MRVLIVDDSAFMRKALASIMAHDPRITVVGQGANGEEALRLARELQPDVITMDIEMPKMDGLSALKHIMAECPTHIIMLSSLTTEGSHAALAAMRAGAADVMAKEASQISLNIVNIRDELLAKIQVLARSKKPKRRTAFNDDLASTLTAGRFKPGMFDLVVIGSSTGGPPVLEQILSGLPNPLGAAVVVAQHMPEVFTRSMAERLARSCKLAVRHGSDGAPIERDAITICPGGANAYLVKAAAAKWKINVNNDEKTPYRPSVDVLFRTAAEASGGRTLAVVLTGMGDDGLRGAKELKAKNASILAQNEETCVVYGMPRAVVINGLADAMSPSAILRSIQSIAPPASSDLRRTA